MALMDSAPEPDQQRSSVLSTLTRFGSVGIVIAASYVGYTFYSRHAADEQAARDLAARQDAARQHQAELIFGSGEIKITNFGVDKGTLTRGESADLCYGVVNATKVTLEPPIEATKPSSLHCLTITPRATTKYTLTASNERGQSLSVTVHVR
jgi:hypothetical protein